MNKYDKLILICAGMVASSGMYAQSHRNDSTVNRTVVVENQYNPEVMDAFKVNVLPNMEEPSVPKQQINYATAGRYMERFPVAAMNVMTHEAEQERAKRGYLRASYGNRNNTDLKGSYLWNITDRDCLDVMASFYGYSGTVSAGYTFDVTTGIPEINENKEWKHKFFRTDASLKYSHTFRSVKLSVGGAFTSQSFKYMPEAFQEYAGNQTFGIGEGWAGISSANGEMPVEFGIETGFKVFSRKGITSGYGNMSEQAVHTKGYFYYRMADSQKIGIDLTVDNIMYENTLKDFSLIKLKPNYKFGNDKIKFQAGVNVDFQTGYSSGLKASPDVKFDYTFAGSFVLYANVSGGTKLNDFRALNEVSPYWIPENQVKTSYTPYDLRLGLKGSPVSGLGLNFYGGYRKTKDDLFSMPFARAGVVFNSFAQSESKVAFAGFTIDYAHRNIVDFGIDLGYFNWKSDDDKDALLWLKPEYYVEAEARFRVFDGLYVWANYLYEGRVSVLGKRTKAVNELNLGSDYTLNRRFSVFVGVNNLLNSKYITDTGYPVQGFNVMGGVSVNF